MDNNLPVVPSLYDYLKPKIVNESRSPITKQQFLNISKSMVSLLYVGVVLFAWHWLPVHYNTNWIVNIICMFFGFFILNKISKTIRSKNTLNSELDNKLSHTPLAQFEEVFCELASAGYDDTVKDSKVILSTAKALGLEKNSIISVMDDSLQYYLTYLLKISQIKKITESRGEKTKGNTKSFFMGSEQGFEGIRIGSLQMGEGEDWEGIKINDKLILGERKAGKASSVPKGQFQSTNNIELTPLEVAASHVTKEIKQLRNQCESILVQSLQGDFNNISLQIRERLEREKMVIEELQQAGININ